MQKKTTDRKRVVRLLKAAQTEIKSKMDRSVKNEESNSKPKGSHYKLLVQFENKSTGETSGMVCNLPESSDLKEISKRLLAFAKELNGLSLSAGAASVHVTRKQ